MQLSCLQRSVSRVCEGGGGLMAPMLQAVTFLALYFSYVRFLYADLYLLLSSVGEPNIRYDSRCRRW